MAMIYLKYLEVALTDLAASTLLLVHLFILLRSNAVLFLETPVACVLLIQIPTRPLVGIIANPSDLTCPFSFSDFYWSAAGTSACVSGFIHFNHFVHVFAHALKVECGFESGFLSLLETQKAAGLTARGFIGDSVSTTYRVAASAAGAA